MAAQGVWSADLAKESFTMREILAVRKVLQSFAPTLARTRTTKMLRVLLISVAGSLVCKATLSVFLRFVFIMAFLLRLNEQSDYLSRIVDFDDWFFDPHIFRSLDLKWEPHSIDRLLTSITIYFLLFLK